jgi:ubiquitin-conjugating enzyme E2 variant
MHTLQPILQALGVILLADFVAGLAHWLEDAYGSEATPVVGPLMIKPNIIHHHYPRLFTKNNWWQSSWDLLALGVVILGLAAWLGYFNWQVVLFVVISVNANQVHKWSHMTRAEVGPVVAFLQDIRVLQTPRHHALHHTDPKNTYYCPVTNLVNPLLEAVDFWGQLEALIEAITGITHRHDTSNRGAGPGPAWLADYRPAHAAGRRHAGLATAQTDEG